jgi:putative SbcD/Mre11-related phosphoesterase
LELTFYRGFVLARGSRLSIVVEGLYVVGSMPVLYSSSDDAFIVADIHLGFEEAMASQGAFLPRLQLRRALKVLSEARSIVEARRVIVNGDIKHSFEKLLKQERVEVREFIVKLQDMGFKEVIVVRGNHDNYVGHLLKELGVAFVEDLLDLGGGVRVTHGHLDLEPRADVTIIGHEHPAIQINIGGSKVKLQALLLIPTTLSTRILVLPALGEYQTGNVVQPDRDKFLSPMVRGYAVVDGIEPFIVDRSLGVIRLPELRSLYEST